MAKEIERKFLVKEEILIPLLRHGDFERKCLSQYYLVSSKEVSVRLRLEEQRHLFKRPKVFLTVKTGGDGMITNEFESLLDSNGGGWKEYHDNLGSRQGSEIIKIRHLVPHTGRIFEVDVYKGDYEGLVVAELEAADAADVTDLPDWISEEVTFDPAYKNAVLALNGLPYAVSSRLAASPGTLDAIRSLNDTGRPRPGIRERRQNNDNILEILARLESDDDAMKALAKLASDDAERAPGRSRALDELATLDAEFIDYHAPPDQDDILPSEMTSDEFFASLLAEDDIHLGGVTADEKATRSALVSALHGHRASSDGGQAMRAADSRVALDTLRTAELDDLAPIETDNESQKGH